MSGDDKTQAKLKLFLGMVAGVGKTYAMLSQTHELRKTGVDAIVGWVDTHGRGDTAALVDGLEVLPRKQVFYRGSIIEEFDLDAALARKPAVIVVDELPHTNAPGSRHEKRYLDVLELLNAGISVYTALNIQHLESRVDTVQDITGVTVRETVPDLILDRADEVVLIDIPPDDLLTRLVEGKIYTPDRAALAAKNFFQIGNLTALRELALRLATERADREVRTFKTLHGIDQAWKSGARLMVAVYASPYSESLIRWTRRLADALGASWIGVYVQGDLLLSSEEERLLNNNMDLVRQLGGEMISTKDDDAVQGLLRAARQNNVTQIVLGKSRRSPVANWLRGGSVADRITRHSGDIDVYTVAAGVDPKTLPQKSTFRATLTAAEDWGRIVATLIVTWLIAAAILPWVGYMAVGVVFLIAVNVASLYLSRRFVVGLAFVFALIHNWFFIPPVMTFEVSRAQDFVMLISFFIAATVTGSLTARLRRKEQLLHERERHNLALFDLARKLSVATSLGMVMAHTVEAMESSFGAGFSIFAKGGTHRKGGEYPEGAGLLLDDKENAVREWVFKTGIAAGKGTQTLAAAKGLYVPVRGRDGVIGVVVFQSETGRALTTEERVTLDMIIGMAAAVMDREYILERQMQQRISDESERLYRTLLDSVSHELKTPLVSIKGAASVLRDEHLDASATLRRDLAGQIVAGSERLQGVVDDLLNMTRLESGMLRPRIELNDPIDLVANVISRLDESQRKRVTVLNPQQGGLILCDGVLLEHAIYNVLRNAVIYSPEATQVQVAVELDGRAAKITIRDHGPGVPVADLEQLFTKFFRVRPEKSGGLGLGLSIAKGFVELQHGTIDAKLATGGGMLFTITMPAVSEVIT